MKWSAVAAGEPALGVAVFDRLIRPGVLLVGTIRRDGSPRISGAEPLVMDQCRLAYLTLASLPWSCRRERRRNPASRDIPGGSAAPRSFSSAVSIRWTLIAESLCTYTILNFHQEKSFRNQGALRGPLCLICRSYAGLAERPTILPGGAGSRRYPL